MGASQSGSQRTPNIDGQPIKSGRFARQREEKEYPVKIMRREDLRFFDDGNMDEVERLIEEGYDPSSFGNKPLSFALRNGHTEIVKLLLRNDKVREKLSELSESDRRLIHSLTAEQPPNAFRSKNKKSARKIKKSVRKSARKIKKSARKTKKSARKTKKSVRKNKK